MFGLRILGLVMASVLFPLTILAQDATNVTSPSVVTTPAQQPNPTQAPTQNGQSSGQQVLCPDPSQLVKNGFYWGTPTGGWKSYSESFDTAVVSFIGAQWVGVNVGKMICIYKGNVALSFPITVQNDTLVQAPTGGAWGNDLGGYRNCHSNNLADCPFIVRAQGVNMQKIYEGLDFYKGQGAPLQNGGSALPPAPSIP